MAANPPQLPSQPPQLPSRLPRGPIECLSAPELADRLEEEINRAGRHGTALSCLLVGMDDLEDIARAHGDELSEQAVSYLCLALCRELRRFDRVGHRREGELLVVLPGADEQRGEIVARRALGRLHAIKLEVDGKRRPLRISVGIAVWDEGLNGTQLQAHARAAAQRQPSETIGEGSDEASPVPPARPLGRTPTDARQTGPGWISALRRS